MAASRVYFASQGIAINNQFVTGVQSIGISINYSLEQAFQMGILGIYDQIATDAEVSVTVTKNLDGGSLLGAGDLKIASNNHDMPLSTTGLAKGGQTVTIITGALVNSETFNFPADGWSTQEVTYFADNKKIGPSNSGISGIQVPTSLGRNTYRHHVAVIAGGPFESGGNITNVTISTDYNLTPMFRLGQLKPHTRYTDYPVETTVEVTIDNTSVDGTVVDLDKIKCTGTAVTTEDFVIQVCSTVSGGTPDAAVYDSGSGPQNNPVLYYFKVPKVTLSSVTQDGGDTGGGNASTTYTYIGYDGVRFSPSGV